MRNPLRWLFAAAAILSALACIVLVTSWQASYVGLGIKLLEMDAANGRPGGYQLLSQSGTLLMSVWNEDAGNYQAHPWGPVWLAVVTTAALPSLGAVQLVRLVRRQLRLENQRSAMLRGLCPSCGYDLRTTPHRCPECGTTP